MICKTIKLDYESTKEAEIVKEKGIGYVCGHTHVADWFVPYNLPIRLLSCSGDDLGVGPMRGSKLGIRLRFADYTRKYESDYYLAERIGAKIARIMYKKKTYFLSFKLNKNHDIFNNQASDPRSKCWSDSFKFGFMDEAVHLGWKTHDEILNDCSILSFGGQKTTAGKETFKSDELLICYLSVLEKEKKLSFINLADSWNDSLVADRISAA